MLACYLLYSKGWQISKIISALGETTLRSLPGFRDAGIGPADFPLSTADVLRGLQLGIQNRWVSNDRYVELQNKECSWVIPDHILACASPSTTVSRQYPSQTPENIIPVFRQLGIKTIVRLNESLYDNRVF